MLVVFLKSVIVFILVFVVIRLMGKRQLGEMQPFELVITLIIAEVACIPMNDPYIPFYSGIIPIITLGMLGILFSFISRKSIVVRRILSGRSMLIIDKQGINYQNLKKLNMNVNDLIEAVRSSGYCDLSTIQYAVIETNGKLCVVEKPADPLKPAPAYLPLELMCDGEYHEQNLALSGTDKQEFEQMLQEHSLSLKDVLYADVRQNGEVYVSTKADGVFTADLNITGGQNW